jgi:hypothetical protein
MFTRLLFGRSARRWVWLLILATWPAQAESREYQIKAAFLVNFMQFVTWPSTIFTREDAPFCIGVLGDDPFGRALDQTCKAKRSTITELWCSAGSGLRIAKIVR